jgi:hypothetical protein
MKIIAGIEAWLWSIGWDWDAKPVREKNVIALIGISLAVLAVMQLALDRA